LHDWFAWMSKIRQSRISNKLINNPLSSIDSLMSKHLIPPSRKYPDSWESLSICEKQVFFFRSESRMYVEDNAKIV
jgi:hypothetical protein